MKNKNMKFKKIMYVLTMISIIMIVSTGCGKEPYSQYETVESVKFDFVDSSIPVTNSNGFQYYNTLTDIQKEMYSNLSKVVTEPTQETVLYTYSPFYRESYLKDAQVALMSFQMDHPEFNPLIQTCNISNASIDSSEEEFEITLILDQDALLNYNSRKQEFEQIANELVNSVKDKTDEEKYQFLHDWLAECTYDYSMKPESHTMYNALVKKEAVCDGLSYAYKYLCDKLNLPCVVVIGQTDGLVGDVGHAWNIVPIGNKWKLVDITYDLYMCERENLDVCRDYFMLDNLHSNSRFPYAGYVAPGYHD